MNTIETIMKRRSIRKYTERPIGDDTLHTILEAGMSAPSCVNARDWYFIAVRNREVLNKMADANGRPAEPLRSCALAILVCGDLEKAFPRAPEYWVIDGAITAENMILAAEDLGIGSVWLGTWPQMDRVKAQAELFELPEHLIPHSIIAFGYPDEVKNDEREVYEADKVRIID